MIKVIVVLMVVSMQSFAWGQQKSWFPVVIDSAVNPFDMEGESRQLSYNALAKASKKWRLCVSIPHLKDDYWMALNYGVVQESRRQGVALEFYQAGGYGNLAYQIKQIKQCVAQGAEAVLIAAIDSEGLNDLVAELAEKNIPVIDLVNGMSSPLVAARSLVSFYHVGKVTAQYIIEMQRQLQRPLKLAWFPGPESAAWVELGNRGFVEALAGHPITIVATRYGDVGRKAQGELLLETFADHDDIDVVVGNAAAILAALPMVRRYSGVNRPELISYYMTRSIYNAIARKQVLAAPSIAAVLQGQLAIDQTVRILEGKSYYKHAGPRIKMIDNNNIQQVDTAAMLAPNGFSAELSIK
ncbi:TMAO reductase system periplasmic protein TorT [Dasania sp. GY-MA-18]|uniref:TMAO reductase system periplasmic protein TorT n=1 Tax=Dasania phycosphaerae TaxID=2950436 RepID=A0A9J6RQ82_9GAMM|nr:MULTISPECIES: TMAO reductase system periplasmic protein TorT [Dasania]MCR8924209.1 TMAO reductase system periplasmic protein TorT [Dasania sp. GY-MA-18]MCZ0866862.1 TMAO reductase system periplasmic protein TorT [Dasania phycosphaerae]MCZ0870367.1 TMAO reductase system periplasmic protein TorT [Dasania phycosphaerae]